jgi:hypothetical protein
VADVCDQEGRLLARAKGEFIELPKDKLELVPENLKDDMIVLFSQFEE